MAQGWIKLHRELMEKAIWLESTPEQKTILIVLLMMANHKGKEWEWQGQRFKAAPGQFITSLNSIAKNCGEGISTQNVRTAIKRFEKYDFLTNQSTNKNRLITIVNWSFYQGEDNEPNKQPNKHLTSNQQAPNKQLTTNKNDKNVKNDKNIVVEKYPADSIEFKLAAYLFKYIKRNDEKAKEPNLQSWSDDIEKIIRIDKRDPLEIKSVIEYAQTNEFWKPNILSAKKLRAKYQTLKLQMNNRKQSKNNIGAFNEKEKEDKRDYLEQKLMNRNF